MTSREVHHATHPDQNAAGNIKHLLGTSLLETLQALQDPFWPSSLATSAARDTAPTCTPTTLEQQPPFELLRIPHDDHECAHASRAGSV